MRRRRRPAGPAPARRAPRPRTPRPRVRHASCRFPPPPRETSATTAERRRRARRATSATIVSAGVPPPPSELFASIVGAGCGRRLRARPVDDRAVGVGLLRPGRCTSRSTPAGRGTGRASPPRSGRCRRVQVTFWITALSPDPVCCEHALPARARDERVDREARRHRQDDLRRRRVLLLGRHGEAVELELVRERHRRADARVRRRAGGETSAPSTASAPRDVRSRVRMCSFGFGGGATVGAARGSSRGEPGTLRGQRASVAGRAASGGPRPRARWPGRGSAAARRPCDAHARHAARGTRPFRPAPQHRRPDRRRGAGTRASRNASERERKLERQADPERRLQHHPPRERGARRATARVNSCSAKPSSGSSANAHGATGARRLRRARRRRESRTRRARAPRSSRARAAGSSCSRVPSRGARGDAPAPADTRAGRRTRARAASPRPSAAASAARQRHGDGSRPVCNHVT